eukprot:NODE_77_length_23338_cov_0.319463.p11 type:complete len:151 gc:universal NODE_77_length_23338_cov_0.319463:15356-14904(-)
MNITELLNPAKTPQMGENKRYKTSKPMNKLTDILEEIYTRQSCPSTELLQSLLSKYPAIPSLVYLRSWFNNRHNKHRRQMNIVREEKLEILIRDCNPIIHLLNDELIDLTKEVTNLRHFKVLSTKLSNLQLACAAYLDIITKFDGPRTNS